MSDNKLISNYGVEQIKTLEGIEAIRLTKQDAQEAINRLVEFFQKYKGDFFGLDDLGIIDLYINCYSSPKN